MVVGECEDAKKGGFCCVSPLYSCASGQGSNVKSKGWHRPRWSANTQLMKRQIRVCRRRRRCCFRPRSWSSDRWRICPIVIPIKDVSNYGSPFCWERSTILFIVIIFLFCSVPADTCCSRCYRHCRRLRRRRLLVVTNDTQRSLHVVKAYSMS